MRWRTKNTGLAHTQPLPGPPEVTVKIKLTVIVFVVFLSPFAVLLSGCSSSNGNSTTSKTTPVITWNTPAAVPAGTALSATQLDATANVAGTFVYSPAAGTVESTAGQVTLNVTFTPTDTTSYNTATASVTLTVNAVTKTTPVITWNTPAAVPAGTALSATQLDATANVAGTFVYSPAAGTVESTAGQVTLNVTFTPTDTTSYNTATASVTLTVNAVTKTTPVITWNTPAAVPAGTALSATQLDATANVAGTFVYSPAAGTVESTAGQVTLNVTFTPTDTTSYNTATASVTLTVSAGSLATPTITWSAPTAITYGTALSATQLNASANYAGTFAYSPASGTVLSAGTQSLKATFTPSDPTKVASATATNSITVNKATPSITWSTPAAVTVGTALSSTQLNATASFGGTSVPGTFVYSPAAGAAMNTAGAQTLSVTFTPTDTADYNSATGSVTLTVNAGTPTAVTVNIDTLANRHQISPFVYGNNDQTISDISDMGYSFSRWGGNDASNYNWMLQTRNSAADWYFEDYGGAGDQVQLITDTQNAGSHALTTMAMMDWVAGEAENSAIATGATPSRTLARSARSIPYNTDAGNGQKTDCSTPVTTNAVTTAYYPLVDTASECPSGTRMEAPASTAKPGRRRWPRPSESGTCPVPYSSITSCHFYDMDNEPDIWNGTHRDVHPVACGL